MKRYRLGVAVAILATAVALASCSSSKKDDKSSSPAPGNSSGSSSAAAQITCANGSLKAEGSTAQTNAINAWIAAYQKQCSGAKINYNPTGSGAGITGFTSGQDDFVGSDSALDPTKGEVDAANKRCGGQAVDLPMVTGPIAVAYKLKGVDKLILNGDVLAKIFLGKIKTWNDSEITKLNPGVTLPSTTISVIYRSDSSGTTQNFERYLAATAPSVFTSKPDKDSSKAGFAGQGKAKSQGVASAIAATEGAIGYDEFSFAVSSSLQTAWIDNGSGAVELSKDSAAAAAGSATLAPNGDGDLTLKLDYATKAAGAYPIILVTYEIACLKYTDAAKGALVKNFLNYAATGGQQALAGLGYAPLPTDLQSKVVASIAKIG